MSQSNYGGKIQNTTAYIKHFISDTSANLWKIVNRPNSDGSIEMLLIPSSKAKSIYIPGNIYVEGNIYIAGNISTPSETNLQNNIDAMQNNIEAMQTNIDDMQTNIDAMQTNIDDILAKLDILLL
jgi:hypothetical protein